MSDNLEELDREGLIERVRKAERIEVAYRGAAADYADASDRAEEAESRVAVLEKEARVLRDVTDRTLAGERKALGRADVAESRLAALEAGIRALADEWDVYDTADEWDAAIKWAEAPDHLRALLGEGGE